MLIKVCCMGDTAVETSTVKTASLTHFLGLIISHKPCVAVEQKTKCKRIFAYKFHGIFQQKTHSGKFRTDAELQQLAVSKKQPVWVMVHVVLSRAVRLLVRSDEAKLKCLPADAQTSLLSCRESSVASWGCFVGVAVRRLLCDCL